MARTGGTSDQLRVIDYWWVTCTGGFGRCGGGGQRVELAAVPPELELVADSSERRFWA
jgi:hypothetical protein